MNAPERFFADETLQSLDAKRELPQR